MSMSKEETKITTGSMASKKNRAIRPVIMDLVSSRRGLHQWGDATLIPIAKDASIGVNQSHTKGM